MVEPANHTIHGIKLRAFSYGSIQLAYMLKLTLFTEDGKTRKLTDVETQRQIVAFAWLQSAPREEVVAAVLNNRSEEEILKFALDIPFEAIPELLEEISRIGSITRASTVNVESKHAAIGEESPGKS